MSLKAITWAFEQQSLTPGNKLMLLAMADVAGDTGKSHSSCETLCRMTGFSKPETISAVQQKLCELGFIADTGKKVGMTGRVKVFQLHPSACKERPDEECLALFGISGNPPSGGVLNPPVIPRQSPGNPPSGGSCHIDGTRNQELGITEEQIYQAYPLKKGRPSALRAIKKAMARTGSAILLEKTREFSDVRDGDLRFCPHPATWYNDERYNDDPSTWLPNENNQRPHTQSASERRNSQIYQ